MRGPLGSSIFSVPRGEKVSSAPQAPSVTDGSPRLGAGQALGQKLPEVLFTLCICRVRKGVAGKWECGTLGSVKWGPQPVHRFHRGLGTSSLASLLSAAMQPHPSPSGWVCVYPFIRCMGSAAPLCWVRFLGGRVLE